MNKLVVLWKDDNLINIQEMVTPYIIASKKNGWWDELEVIIWGASQKKVVESEEIQRRIKLMIKQDIPVYACRKCAEDLGIAELLKNLNINVLYTGELLTERLKSEATVITL